MPHAARPDLPAQNYRPLTGDPDPAVVVPDRPAVRPPPDPPPVAVVDPTDEPLVEVAHPRITHLHAYRWAGWRHAVDAVLLRRGVVDALQAAVDRLPADTGLAIFDAWRPWALQRELHHAYYAAADDLPPGYLHPPGTDPRLPPPHTTGGAVDLTVTLAGRPLALGTGFDEMCADAAPAAFEARPGPVRALRRLLIAELAAVGFVVDPMEWWHHELGTGGWAARTGGRARYGPALAVHGAPAAASAAGAPW